MNNFDRSMNLRLTFAGIAAPSHGSQGSLTAISTKCNAQEYEPLGNQVRVSRRKVIHMLSFIPLASLPTEEIQRHRWEIAQQVANCLRLNCEDYLRQVAPLSDTGLMWRGHEHPPKELTRSSPKSDLLSPTTYGRPGADFFSRLDNDLTILSAPDSNVPRPSNAHIATGSRDTAAQWGFPLTVWPTSPFLYAVRTTSQLIYTPGEAYQPNVVSNGGMIFGNGLRRALHQGHEVLFECPSFYILPLHLHHDVVKILQSQTFA